MTRSRSLRWLRWVWLGCMMAGVGLPETGRAQSAGGSEEVRRLRDELEAARQELRVLREENARLRGAPGLGASTGAATAIPIAPPAAASTAGGAGAPATGIPAGAVVLPAPVAEGTVVTVEQLLGEYRQSTLAGDARYKGRRFRLQGNVRGFKKTFGGLTWLVELQAEGQLGLVRCSVSVPGMSDFRPAAGDRVLEARRPFKAWQRILAIGETFVVEGVGAGVSDAMVVMKDCHPVG